MTSCDATVSIAQAKPLRFSPVMKSAAERGFKTTSRRLPEPDVLEAIEFYAGMDQTPGEIGVAWMALRDDDHATTAPQWCLFDTDYPEEGAIGVGRLYGAPDEVVSLCDNDGAPFARARIKRVSIEQVQDITEQEVLTEGVVRYTGVLRWISYINPLDAHLYPNGREAFAALWDGLHGAGAWERNDFVIVVEYSLVSAETEGMTP